MPCTARSRAEPPPWYQDDPSPPRPVSHASVPCATDDTARSGSAIPRSTGAGNIRSAYWLFTLLNYSSGMRADDMIMVSVDDHLVEPPDMFERHLPARWASRDEAPREIGRASCREREQRVG